MTRLAWLTLGGDLAAAEDAVSETWVRCLPRLAGMDRPEPYLRVALINVCLNQLRHEQVVQAHAQRNTGALSAVVADDPHLVELADVLTALAPQQRAVIALRYLHDCEDGEIAEALGVTRATVRSHARHALANLREVLSR